MGYDEATREALDWSMLTMAIDRFCGTCAGRRLVQKSVFAESPSQARELYYELEELQHCIQEDHLPPFRGMPDIYDLLKKSKRKEALELSEILLIVQLVELIKESKNWLREVVKRIISRFSVPRCLHDTILEPKLTPKTPSEPYFGP